MLVKNKIIFLLLVTLFVFGFKNEARAVDPTTDPTQAGLTAASDQLIKAANIAADVNSCTCGTGKTLSCVQYTLAELTKSCPSNCVKKIAEACPAVVSPSLSSLQQTASKVLNKAPFAGGLAGAQQLIAKIINFLIFPIGMFAMVFYVYAGFLWMSANSESIEKSKTILTWTTLGIIVTLSAYLLIKFVFSLL